ncbi:hypothetical protein ANRL3_01259 [Anaerolineae bacterium]|nr:hypothetical protein ANRL3_01259 [Anaerolineae bacterium]
MQTVPRKKRVTAQTADQLDLSHLNASPLKIMIPDQRHRLHLYLVGCGGTGSWLAPHLVRLARFLRETRNLNTQITFVDPDVVEMKNVFRQNFGEAEVGGHKAALLALRYSAPWGMTIQVHAARFDQAMVRLEYGDLGVIVGCVDNAAARKSIADSLDQESRLHGGEGLPRMFWLDCGNAADTGQVLFGAARNVRQLQYAFPYLPDQSFCVNLPAPDLQHPDLLQVQPETNSTQLTQGVSCAEMLLIGDQSPSINAMVANIAATYLWRLFADPQGLKLFATYCNLNAFSMRSHYITPDNIAQALNVKGGARMFKPGQVEKRIQP